MTVSPINRRTLLAATLLLLSIVVLVSPDFAAAAPKDPVSNLGNTMQGWVKTLLLVAVGFMGIAFMAERKWMQVLGLLLCAGVLSYFTFDANTGADAIQAFGKSVLGQ